MAMVQRMMQKVEEQYIEASKLKTKDDRVKLIYDLRV